MPLMLASTAKEEEFKDATHLFLPAEYAAFELELGVFAL